MICITCGAPTHYYTIFNALGDMPTDEKFKLFKINLKCCKTVYLNLTPKGYIKSMN